MQFARLDAQVATKQADLERRRKRIENRQNVYADTVTSHVRKAVVHIVGEVRWFSQIREFEALEMPPELIERDSYQDRKQKLLRRQRRARGVVCVILMNQFSISVESEWYTK